MSDIKFNLAGGDCDGERGERGERGHRGHRGHDGHDGHDGATGATGPTGPTGATGASGATGSTGPTGVAPVIAAALVNSNGSFPGNSPGFTAVTQTGTGVYTLTLANTPADPNNRVIEVSLGSLTGGEISWVNGPGPNQFTVHIFDSTGTPADHFFSVVVYDVT